MAIRIALFAAPAIAAVGVVLLLNDLHASAGIAAASLGLIAILGGAAFGYFADRLPEIPRARNRRDKGATRLAGVHDGRR
jgi:cyanate permease